MEGRSRMLFSAQCPACQAEMYTYPSAGQSFGLVVQVQCAACGWRGPLTFPGVPGTGLGVPIPGFIPPGGVQPPGALSPSRPPSTSPLASNPEPNPLDARRDALRTAGYELLAEACNELRAVTATGWDMPLWRRYERLQAAHEALFEALGGRRMGDYLPAIGPLRAALVQVLVWELLALDGAWQVGE